jgi:hypothetical protein
MPMTEADKVERGYDGDARPLLSGRRRRCTATLTHVGSHSASATALGVFASQLSGGRAISGVSSPRDGSRRH